jgi:DNA-binding NarL/FixJ family response regulator
MALRVLLADDELITLEGVRLVLEAAEGISVVGEVHTALELSSSVARTRPELVLLNPGLRGSDDYGERFDAILAERGGLRVVVFSESSDPRDIERAFAAGAAAYIVKTINPLSLPAALRATAERTVFHTCHPPGGWNGANGGSGLTERELDILAAVAYGLSNRAISQELGVSEQTVKFHLANVYRKIGVLSRTAAVRYALDRDIVAVESPSPGTWASAPQRQEGAG